MVYANVSIYFKAVTQDRSEQSSHSSHLCCLPLSIKAIYALPTVHYGECIHLEHDWPREVGGGSAVCFMFYLLSDTGAGFTGATCLGLETASVALEPLEQADEGALDVHRSLQTHPLHWAQPQQMGWHCGAEFRREGACGWEEHCSACKHREWVVCEASVLGCVVRTFLCG